MSLQWALCVARAPRPDISLSRPFMTHAFLSSVARRLRHAAQRSRFTSAVIASSTDAGIPALSPRRRALAYHIQKLSPPGPRDPAQFREDFLQLVALLRARKIHPVVAERLPLAEARRAHELLETSASVGKLVLLP